MDVNQLAAAIREAATSGKDLHPPTATKSAKNPAAVALGRLGGLKGGKARDKKLSSEQKSAIAQRAAAARWGKKS